LIVDAVPKCKQGNRRYHTSTAVCNHTVNSIYFINLSPIDAKLTTLSYIHLYKHKFVSSPTYSYHNQPAFPICVMGGDSDFRFGR